VAQAVFSKLNGLAVVWGPLLLVGDRGKGKMLGASTKQDKDSSGVRGPASRCRGTAGARATPVPISGARSDRSNAILAASIVVQLSSSSPPVSPEFGLRHQKVYERPSARM
jgi:hypothetical protein